ncbi:MAG: FAD-dependent oxidoreductase [Chloroflexi bacterium HGW-Chloroflexi-10]|nr:MAG: FAD-dependent oxidoreductase [Chloroflexi bacterium HGW-Chloroflexi-10]
MKNDHVYDAVIVGGGHNGLIASCYLAMAGLRVLILEKNDHLGGATWSNYTFPGVNVRVSEYSYLISLLPQKILSDLGISFEIRQRPVASFTPLLKEGIPSSLLISNTSEDITRNSFITFTGDDREYQKYRILQEKLAIFARNVWPTLLSPLPSKKELRDKFQSKEEREIWDYLVEKPLSALIEDHLTDDTLRGMVFTDAKIGLLTNPDDPTLLQNKTFIYHIIGQGTGEWSVPVGGMGALVDALKSKAQALGVSFETSAKVVKVDHGVPTSVVWYTRDEKELSVAAQYVLFNTASNIVNQCLPHAYAEKQVDGSVFKINMILKKLPGLKGDSISSKDAFTGTFHLNEGYQHMKTSYQNAQNGVLMDALPGEMYCHSLTDPSILSADLQEKGYQTLTLFGLDVPYHWFTQDNAATKDEIARNYLRSINNFIEEDILDCLAADAAGNLCFEAKSPVDLESSIDLPKGNIFHGNLTWPFAEIDDDAGAWGVETNYKNVFICGSSAKRGGAVSGIPGHNAAMKVLETAGRKFL